MSNLYNTIRSPVRTTTMTNKSKSHIVTNDLVERKTRALEGSLNKAKLNMQQQYQTKSTSTNPPRRNVDNKETKQNIREKQTDLFPTKPKKLIKCGQCDKDEAKVKCLECVENYCANCYAEFHVRGALQRHHRILLSPFKKRNPSLSSDILLNNDSSEQQSNSIYPEKTTSLFSFQQSFLQWRDNNNTNKGQRKPEGGPTATDKVDYSKKLPYIERTNLTKKQTHTQKNSGHELKRTSIPKIGPLIDRSYSLTDTIHGNQPITDIEPTHEDLSTSNIEIITNNENPSERERSATHISTKSSSRPSSAIIRTDSFRSRPNSSTQIQQSLLPVSTDDLEGNTESQLILSRPTSTRSEKFDPPLNPLDYVENIPPTQLHLPLENIFEESKMDLDYQITDSTENLPRLITPNDELSTYAFCMNSTVITPTPGRNSPFSFSNSLSRLNRLDSASSRDTTVCGFFTEVVHRKKMLSPTTPPPPLPILESSTLNESRFTLENDLHPVEIEKSSRKSSVHEVSKESIVDEEKQQQSKVKIENDSRPGSSSLPFSRPSSRKSSLSQKPIIETSTSSSQPEIVDSTKTENKLETSSSHINDESINLLKNKDESENTNTLPTKKKIRRRRQRPIMTYDDPSGYRKLEFSIGDGLKWQEASMESMSSTIHSEPSSTGTTPRMMSPSNPVNNKLSEQFSKYDHDDGRSSRTYQNLIDEECFNQLRQELCSELNLEGSDEDSILNDQIIKMIQDSRNRFNEKDWLKINTKLRDNDSTQQSTLDNNNFLIHE